MRAHVRFSPDPPQIMTWLSAAGEALFETRLRLGVTGLSGAGKTVFTTALVHNLLTGGGLDRLTAYREGRIKAAVLRPQPNQDVPRFPYEAAVDALTGQDGPPRWPDSTRTISELRLSLRVASKGLRRHLGDRIVHLDVFDYPGEWLADLTMLPQSYAEWCRHIWSQSFAESGADQAWRETVAALDPEHAGRHNDRSAERALMDAAETFTASLHAERAGNRQAPVQPGRFVMPGDLQGSPLLTFVPLKPPLPDGRAPKGSIRALCEERFEAYKRHVVKPFFSNHFARLDRQIVLVDVASALAGGASGRGQLAGALDTVLQGMRLGRPWPPPLNWLVPSIDRVLMAATKADLVPTDQHRDLVRALDDALGESRRQAAFRGAETESIAIAAIKATRDVIARARNGGERYIAGTTLDDRQGVAHYPGRVYPWGDPGAGAGRFENLVFAPPDGLGANTAWPHLNLDRALDFLVSDWLE